VKTPSGGIGIGIETGMANEAECGVTGGA